MTMPEETAIEDGSEQQKSNTDSDTGVMGRKASVDALKALAPNTHPPRQTLPFPPEIRLKVLGHLFKRSYKVVWRPSKHKCYPESLSILQVSLICYQEAYEVLYDRATFQFDICDLFKYGSDVGTAYEEIVKRMTHRMKHVSIVFWDFSRKEAIYQQAIESTNELVRAVTLNPRLLSLKLVMNENALERLATMEALTFLNLAVPTIIHVKGHSFHMLPRLKERNRVLAQSDKVWKTVLRELEARNGPIEVVEVPMGEDDKLPLRSIQLHFFALLRLQEVSTQDAPT